MRSVLRTAHVWIGVPLVVFGLAMLVRGRGAGRFVGKSAPPIFLNVEVGRDTSAPFGTTSGSEGERTDRIEALRGKVILLDFWASWCGPCRASVSILNQMQARYGSRGLVVIGINNESSLDLGTLAAAHRAFGMTYPTLHDENRETSERYGIEALPTLFLIDRAGIVREAEMGVPREEWLASKIEDLLE